VVQIGGPDPYENFAKQSEPGGGPSLFPLAGTWELAQQAPPDTGFAWPTATPSSQNINAAGLAAAYTEARTSANLEHVHSLLVIKNGFLVGEEYFKGLDAAEPANIKSSTKSIQSALIGIAIDLGYLEGKDQLISDFFPEWYATTSNACKEQIEIQDLLTMRGGFEWTQANNLGPMNQSLDWASYVLDLPMEPQPGAYDLIFRAHSTGYTRDFQVSADLNGSSLGAVPLDGQWATVSLPVPAGLVRAGLNTLTFRSNFCGRPKDYAPGSGDDRELSLEFDYLSLAPSAR
jgi:hypothetical protein